MANLAHMGAVGWLWWLGGALAYSLLGWAVLRAYMRSDWEIRWPWELWFLLLCGPAFWFGAILILWRNRKR